MTLTFDNPKMQVIIDGATISENCISTVLNLKENAISEVTLIANDEQGETYLNDVNLNDTITIKFKYEDFGVQTWGAIPVSFSGEVVDLQPQLDLQNEVCAIKGYGIGIGLKRMLTGEEYGIQSKHPQLGSLREIVTDETFGIIPRYFNQIFGSLSSGYTIGTDHIADIAQDVNYLMFNFEPCLNSLNDLLAVLSSLLRVTPNYNQPGLHWIVTPNNELCVAPIGDHDVAGSGTHNVKDVWPTRAYRPDFPEESILYLPMDEGTGATTYDKSGNNNNGIIDGATWVAGKMEYGLHFDGTNDHIDIATSTDFDFYPTTDDGISFSFWIKTTDANTRDIISRDIGGGSFWLIRIVGGQIYAQFWDGTYGSWSFSSITINDGAWHHIVISLAFSNNTTYVYVDGADYTLPFGAQDIGDHFNGTNPIKIAYGTFSGGYFAGDLDEVIFFQKPLTITEVKAIYNATVPFYVLEVADDMIESSFSAKKPEGNYILCTGVFCHPPNLDLITEENADEWDVWLPGMGSTITDIDTETYVKEGDWSLKFHIPPLTDDRYNVFFYPKTGDLDWNIGKIGTRNNIPEIGFWFRSGGWVNTPCLVLYAPDYAHRFEISLDGQAQDVWMYRVFQLGVHAQSGWTDVGGGNWNDIHKVGISYTATISCNADVWLDGLHLFGIVTRAAYSSSSITEHGAKMGLVVDSLAIGDSLDPDDDTCAIALTAKAELFRRKATSTTGTIRVPLMPAVTGGQLVHIHASRTEDTGTYPSGFKIDENFRILQHTLVFTIGGVYSVLYLTNDLTNSLLPMPNLYNALFKATEFGAFRNKDSASLKAKDVDFEQTPIEKNYG